jgi:hypothetical protein
MSFFEIVGMIVTGIVALAFAGLIVLLIINFIGYQKGARNYRDYVYYGEDRGQWFWTKYGAKCWARSFKRGGGWHVETADPEDDNYDLRIYENGSITRHPTRYPA